MLLSQMKSLCNLLSVKQLLSTPVAGLKNYQPPPPKKNIEYPDRVKLKLVEKVPQYGTIRPFKMQKRLRYIRGPETVHTELLHQQFGIVAIRGGRMKHEHFETARMTFAKRFKKIKNLFAFWRVDPPWQPVTKKALGHKMGGGKSPIDHYVTPVKAGRIILEVGGDIEYYQVQKVMENIAMKMPFPAKAVTYEMMMAEQEEEERLERENLNPYTWKYIIQNNLGGCHNWITPTDKRYFNKHL
ncbi:39S ribosomal protein L16, mitochondrial [Chelonus insularis]|uniref:39S ribosomal protein L16, mitochondrial n=1 Tax=Chelonus insularis TaxID=460826 RepID=UPI00158EBAE4|nr:39S ribosomal protein L16, mitochondrial [Chelonus insularis]